MGQQEPIPVGIIGASAKSGWARMSHVPAIKSLPDLKLAAVATNSEQSAREAAESFGADRWFSDPFAMIRDDRLDVITVAVKVPAHREYVLAAMAAGKAVYCEAPLGRSVSETEEMARATSSLHTAIGLQGRMNPSIRRAADLVSSGRVGRPLSARVVCNTFGFGPELPVNHDYFNKASSGANLLTINGGHTLDAVEAILGDIVEIDARTEIVWPTVMLKETGEKSSREVPDLVSILGKTTSGAIFTADVNAGVTTGETFRFEIRGTEGWLTLLSDHRYGFQAGEIELRSNIAFTPPDEPAVSGAPAEAINVGEVYASLVRDMHAGTYGTPGFQHALHNARLIEAVRRAGASPCGAARAGPANIAGG